MIYRVLTQVLRFSKMQSKGIRLFVIMAALLSVCVPSTYADTVFDFTGLGGVGTIGNSRSFTSGGITVTATAWGYTYDVLPGTDNALGRAALGQGGSGLGVCDISEFDKHGCNTPGAPVDNVGPDNWVLFTFSQAVDPVSVRLYVNTAIYADWDIAYRVGNVTLPVNLEGLSYLVPDDLGIPGIGFGDWMFAPSATFGWPLTVAIGGNHSVNALLIGASFNELGGGNDGFKITSLNVTPVPEPISLLLLGTGLLSLAGVGSLSKRARKH